MNYDVTIGIPVYNVERYICSALESALAQTYQSIEFLIVDDCCTDMSIDIVRNYQQKHSRGCDIHIIHQPYNMGVSMARNCIIDEAQGSYLYFMDSDDVIEPDTITLLMKHQRRIDADIVFGSSDKLETFNNNRVVDIIQYPQRDLLGEDQLACYAFRQYRGLQTNIWNFCVKLDILRKSGLRFQNINYWEDMVFMFDLVTYCNRSILLPQITYHYLCRYDSLSNYQERNYIKREEIERNIFAVDFMKQHTERLKLRPYYSQCCYYVMMTYFYIVCNIIKNQNKIMPPYSKREMRDILAFPLSLKDILSFKSRKFEVFFLYLLGVLPPSVSINIVSVLGKSKGLIV